jgi:hypothetical protein
MMGCACPAEIGMRRRWKVALLLAAGCALLGVAGWALLRPPAPSARINEAAYERIEDGMTPAEVEAVIGLPPGDYRSDPARPRAYAEFMPQQGVRVLEWVGDDSNIQVRVDERTGRVVSKIMGEPLPSPLRAAWDQVRSWLDL